MYVKVTITLDVKPDGGLPASMQWEHVKRSFGDHPRLYAENAKVAITNAAEQALETIGLLVMPEQARPT